MTTPPQPTHNLRVLFASDHPDALSGYSVETKLTALNIRDHCHLALLATFGLHGSIQDWNGIPLFPGGADAFSNDVIAKAARLWQADVVITLKDVMVFNPASFQGFRWCPMTPIDHDPSSPEVIERCRVAYRPIAYAPQGFRALRQAGLDPLYAPHAYDPKVYYPMDRAEARKVFNIPDDLFIVGTVAVNRGGQPSRKCWNENLEAFALFAKDKPNVRYFLHTDVADDRYEAGIPLRRKIARLGIADKVMFCDQDRYRYKSGFPHEYMRAFYNSLDVLNAVSMGEGFGIPTLEAQACGTPVIVGDWCAHEDLCWGGWKVLKSEAHGFDDLQQDGGVFIPQPTAIADRLEKAYGMLRTEAPAYRALALAGAVPYQIETVVRDHWLPLLAELEKDIRTPRSPGVLRIIRREEVFPRAA